MITPTERERRFLQSLWQNRLFECQGLVLADGVKVQIVNVGVRSENSALLPDFAFAAIRYSATGVTMHGNVKIDTRSSQWSEQGTVNAPEFDSVILHVVFVQDIELSRGGVAIPTLVLRAMPTVVARYDELRRGAICADYLGQLDTVYSHHILTRVMSDRLSRKSDEMLSIFDSTGHDWHETAYICFMRAFGYREKKQLFETLARAVPLKVLRLYSDSLCKMEALLLGRAGYLDVPSPDNYTRSLQREYAELHLPDTSWCEAVVRAGSLPVQSLVRIAAILRAEEPFLDRILVADSYRELRTLFDVPLSGYWENHAAPSRQATINGGGMTRQRGELLIINFVIPFLATYGTVTSNERLRDRAIDLYESMPPEDNRYTRQWAGGGFVAQNAFFSQALIQLTTEYCTDGMCGSCPLGTHYIREGKK